jgi:hypothetical protein
MSVYSNAPRACNSRTIIGRDKLTWRQSGRGLALLYRGSPITFVVPDVRHAGMWRMKRPDGRVSDMVNLSRASDAAVALALFHVNHSQEGKETPRRVPYMRANEKREHPAIGSAGGALA